LKISGYHGGEYEDDRFLCTLIKAVMQADRTSETSVYFSDIARP
jgi:hypothetical protein